MDDNTRIVLLDLLKTIREYKAYIGGGALTTTLSATFKAELLELIQLFAST